MILPYCRPPFSKCVLEVHTSCILAYLHNVVCRDQSNITCYALRLNLQPDEIKMGVNCDCQCIV